MSDTITITGTIGTPPDFKRKDGLAITSFRLASSHRYRDAETKTWVDGETSWYSVSIFRGLAENAYASLRKGERVIVTGKLRVREWETSVKKGVTAQIDADSIGHDLRFGTTQFSKVRGGSVTAERDMQPHTSGGDQWAPPQDEDEAVWVGPGLAPATGAHDGEHAHEEPDNERELALVAGEPPF